MQYRSIGPAAPVAQEQEAPTLLVETVVTPQHHLIIGTELRTCHLAEWWHLSSSRTFLKPRTPPFRLISNRQAQEEHLLAISRLSPILPPGEDKLCRTRLLHQRHTIGGKLYRRPLVVVGPIHD